MSLFLDYPNGKMLPTFGDRAWCDQVKKSQSQIAFALAIFL